MGVWGPGIFADDLACDVRGRYRDLLGEGHDSVEVTDAMIEGFREVLADEDSAAVFWLALAVTQWRLGRLEERVKESALRAIEDGGAWRPFAEDEKLLRKRKAELNKTAELLRSEQPAAKRVRKQFKNSCDWEPGELISYRLRSGNLVLFRVVRLFTDQGGTAPVVEVLDWCGPEVPEMAVLEELGVRYVEDEVPLELQKWFSPRISLFLLSGLGARKIHWGRITRLHVRLPVPEGGDRSFFCWFWRTMDEKLEKEFGWA
ncbi:MAG: hypothetical protein J0L64_28900 [Acidobacteria bacterium]|nr:hypothetical protein [Acidobacteriota bacterium]